MKLRGSLLVIVCSFVVELCNVTRKDYLVYTYQTRAIIILAIQGLLFLLYPLIGHLTDVYLTRYRSLKWSFGILIIAGCAAIVYCAIDLTATYAWYITVFHHKQLDVHSNDLDYDTVYCWTRIVSG